MKFQLFYNQKFITINSSALINTNINAMKSKYFIINFMIVIEIVRFY